MKIAIAIQSKNVDLYPILRMACVEAKKKLGTRNHVTPIKVINEPWGHIVVVEYNGVYEKSSGVRGSKMDEK